MSTRKSTTVTLSRDTADRIDAGRAALAAARGRLSRASFVAAAVEHYLADLADEGYAVGEVIDPDQFTDLAGRRLPFRPRANWAIVDRSRYPHRVQLAEGRGPQSTAALVIVAEILPHLTATGAYTRPEVMLDLAGFTVDPDREPDTLSDGRDMIPIRV